MKPVVIGLLGKPLAGKDTALSAIRKTFGETTESISIGAIINEVKKQGESHRFWPLLHEAIAIADAGGIVPGESINQCMEQLIHEAVSRGKTTIVWVAGPRNQEQLVWLDQWTRDHGFREQFLHLDIPDEVAYQRLDGRNEGRVDDKREVLAVRLQKYEEITKPVVDTLRSEGRLLMIDGSKDAETVGNEIISRLSRTPDPEITLPPMARR